ncbi:hypothetical protein HY605_03715 [Candidatus Peregrinibacteria bacterium]|nr:hypothetical protein [Candidatus Peregrinibacteria bacterium]
MYGLSADFDTSIFVGKMLECVVFGINIIHFRFDDELSISLESSFKHRMSRDQKEREVIQVPVSDSHLMRLTGKVVVSAKVECPGTLTLEFEDGQVLSCIEDSSLYESYQITYGEKWVIVV